MKLIDPCNRHLNYLRISITDRCNLKCIYCVPRDQIPRLTHKDILTYEEILRIVEIGVRLGISKLRVTGGEPLVRKGVYGFLQALSRIDGVADLSLTTNGLALKDNLAKFEERFGAIPPKPAAAASSNAAPRVQQLYDELKLEDEMLAGCYANAVMINHAASEFKFDFLANILPRSIVTSRVFMAAGQVPQVVASLEKTWTQFQQQLQQKPKSDPPQEESGDSEE